MPKTSGGIKYFASDPHSILKWTLNRSTQARNTQALYDLADINCSEDVYKSPHPSHFLKFEQLVKKLINVMAEEPAEFYRSQEKPTASLIDLMALIRAIAGLGATYEELALKEL